MAASPSASGGLGRFAVRLSWPFRPALLDAGVGGVLRRQPGRDLRVRRLGDRPLPLHLDQLHAGVRVPHLGAPAHAGGARRGHGDDRRGHRRGRGARHRVGRRADRGPADGGHVPGHGVARPAQAHRGAGVAPVRRGERPAARHPAAVPPGRLAPAPHADHHRSRPRRTPGRRPDRPPGDARHRGRAGRAEPATADRRTTAGHRGRRGTGVPPDRGGRAGRLHHGDPAPVAAHRRSPLAARPAGQGRRAGRPGAARPGRRRLAGERGPAHRQRGRHQAVRGGGGLRAAGSLDRRRHRPGHPGRPAAARLRPVPQRRQRPVPGHRPRAGAGERRRPGARR